MTSDETTEVLTNLAKPKTAATITVRIIKSFDYRTQKNLVLKDVNLEATTVEQLKCLAVENILDPNQSGWKAYKSIAKEGKLDTLKLYTKAHGAKTTNLIINLDHDEWILHDESKTLADVGFENEVEVSFFNLEDYERFKSNPQILWESENLA